MAKDKPCATSAAIKEAGMKVGTIRKRYVNQCFFIGVLVAKKRSEK
jgi:hypothetical protein